MNIAEIHLIFWLDLFEIIIFCIIVRLAEAVNVLLQLRHITFMTFVTLVILFSNKMMLMSYLNTL